MKDTTVFTPGKSNFGLLMSESENSSAGSDVSDHEEVQTTTVTEEEGEEQATNEPAEEENWCPVVKKERKPSSASQKLPKNNQHYAPKTAFIGNGTKKVSQPGHHHAPVSVDEIKLENSLELHGFTSKYRTGHLRKFVETVATSGTGYRLKWQNDTSCWVVFDDPEMLKKALVELQDEVVQVRPFAPENLLITAVDDKHHHEEAQAATSN